MLGIIGARVCAVLAGAWAKLVMVGAAVVAVLGVYAAIRKGGRDSQLADDAINVEKRTRLATQARIEASKPITPQEEANDPWNRDRTGR